MAEYRIEHDTMGEVRVPADALYRAQTQRAVENFPISGITLERRHIEALARIKKAAARANAELGVLDADIAAAIVEAADAVAGGAYDADFPIDIFQTGSGTSSNMNANEVIATLATRSLGRDVHPNDHVNASQSSNDVFPTSVHVAAASALVGDLVPKLTVLADSLDREVRGVRRRLQVRPHAPHGRHPSDAWPGVRRLCGGGSPRDRAARVGAAPRCRGAARRHRRRHRNQHPRRASRSASSRCLPRTRACPSPRHATTSRRSPRATASSRSRARCKVIAVSLTKICNDLRWMGSGPNTGLGEISLPDLQPGSSIMPGKVNPVVPEAVLMVCARVIGNDATVAWAGASGAFELNVQIPVMALGVLESMRLLANSAEVLATKTVDGITANVERARFLAEASPSIVTPLNRVIGYENAAKIAKHSVKAGLTVREATIDLGFVERGELTLEQLDALLDVTTMVGDK